MSEAVTGRPEMPAYRLALGGRTMSQGMFGGIALVLGIVGLAVAGTRPGAEGYLDAIAQISLGVALIVFGVALAGAYARLLAKLDPAASLGGTVTGTTADIFLGGTVIILGVLALLQVVPEVLVPVAVILIGSGLMLNSIASVRAATLELSAVSAGDEQTLARRAAEELAFATAGVRAIAGLAVSILGILSLVNPTWMVLTLTAAIVGGAAILLASTTLSSRVTGALSARS